MSPIEEKVTSLLTDLAEARPVQGGTPPRAVRDGSSGTRARRPDYVISEPPTARSRRGPVLVAAAVLLVMALLGGLLVLGRDGGRPPVVASRSDLPVETALLGAGRMAVVVENQLHVADGPTGQVWKLTDTGDGEEVSNVSFSYDGQWVAFTIHDESGLWVSRWDGSERHRIGPAPSRYTWSPTDGQLAYATQDEVRIAQTDGSSRALEGGPGPRPHTNVVWSPDGESLAFAQEGFPGDDQGGLITVTPEGSDDPGWGKPSQYWTPAEEVVAWPLDGVVLVAGEFTAGAQRSLQAALLWSLDTEVLLGLPAGSLVTSASDGSRVAAHLADRPSIERCDLVGSTMPCGPIWLSEGTGATSAPTFSPDGGALAIVGRDPEGRTVLTVADAPGTSGIEPTGELGVGVQLTESSADRPGHGTDIEAPTWIDEGRLLVRAGDRVVLVTRTEDGGAAVTPVVEGDRFLPPEDDLPGGTGLAYWSPS